MHVIEETEDPWTACMYYLFFFHVGVLALLLVMILAMIPAPAG